jgi:hypothetical protein
MGPPVGPPVALEVAADDFHAAGEYAAQVRRQLAQLHGVA